MSHRISLEIRWRQHVWQLSARLSLMQIVARVTNAADSQEVYVATNDRAQSRADASPSQIEELLAETDRVAEIHNTLRPGCPMRFDRQA